MVAVGGDREEPAAAAVLLESRLLVSTFGRTKFVEVEKRNLEVSGLRDSFSEGKARGVGVAVVIFIELEEAEIESGSVEEEEWEMAAIY